MRAVGSCSGRCRRLFAEQRHEFFRTEPGGAKGGEQDNLVESVHTRKQHGTVGAHEHHGCGRFCGANEAGAAKRPKAVGPQDVAQAIHGSTLSKERSVRHARHFRRILWESSTRGHPAKAKCKTMFTPQFGNLRFGLRRSASGAPFTALRNVQSHGLQPLQHARIPPPADLVRAQAFIAIHAALVSDPLVREKRDVPYDRASAEWTWHVGALPLRRASSKR